MSKDSWIDGYKKGYDDGFNGSPNIIKSIFSRDNFGKLKKHAWNFLQSKITNRLSVSDEELVMCIEVAIFSDWLKSGGNITPNHPSLEEYSCHWVNANQYNLPFLIAFEDHKKLESKIYKILIEKYPNPKPLQIRIGESLFIMK